MGPGAVREDGSGAGDYGNHDLANRPASPKITNIVIHNTEASYDTTLKLVHATRRTSSWQYTPAQLATGTSPSTSSRRTSAGTPATGTSTATRSASSTRASRATGAEWFSEPMYRSSARLVRYLATKYDIPLDMQHIFGHDQIPGVTPANVAGMHWDPGPYWNWEHYFQLLGAPLSAHQGAVTPRTSSASCPASRTTCSR